MRPSVGWSHGQPIWTNGLLPACGFYYGSSNLLDIACKTYSLRNRRFKSKRRGLVVSAWKNLLTTVGSVYVLKDYVRSRRSTHLPVDGQVYTSQPQEGSTHGLNVDGKPVADYLGEQLAAYNNFNDDLASLAPVLDCEEVKESKQHLTELVATFDQGDRSIASLAKTSTKGSFEMDLEALKKVRNAAATFAEELDCEKIASDKKNLEELVDVHKRLGQNFAVVLKVLRQMS